MNIAGYLDDIRAVHATGQATEHSYRPALQKLFAGIDPDLSVVNEPKKAAVGAPDFIFMRGEVPIGWCEAKDVKHDIRKLDGYSKEQKDRYKRGLPNLLYTNGLDFEFIRNGDRTAYVTVADLIPGLPARPDRFGELQNLLGAFAAAQPISITSAAQLARMMAAKAAIIKDVLGNVLREDAEFRSSLGGQYRAFKADLLPNLDPGEFADIYAETITYGMFAARLNDPTLDSFSRREALELLPKSNPFLRSLFGYIAGPELDDRLRWIVDDLADILRASDPQLLFRDFGRFTARNDPFVHFYEDFLKEYNPAKRKSRGVWYTPEPVVDFIVRAVDDVLRTEFGLPDGLADTGKVVVDHDTGQTHPKTGKPVTVKREVHRVQILDPATGTGTFLAKAVQTIAARVKARAPGKWSGYVESDLIPRLHGFELLMASYAMCHMKLDMQLRETGYVPSGNPPRLSVWLTNALEEGTRDVRDLFFTPLAEEARGANEVKRNRPIMCVIGNPPYSGESANKGAWITGLMDAYKKEPGGKLPLDEHQTRWLLDDYVKFIRRSEFAISRSAGGGVLGFITNHSYLDNPTFRGMRWHLMSAFDDIMIIDLHGNKKKKEVAPDGSPDDNVFDIQQGTAIIIAIKKAKSDSKPATVRHFDFWGKRDSKYEQLWSTERAHVRDVKRIIPQQPFFSFAPNMTESSTYDSWPSIEDLLNLKSSGTISARDGLVIDYDRERLWTRISELNKSDIETFRKKYDIGDDSKSWSLASAQQDVRDHLSENHIVRIQYRPFDTPFTFYTGRQGGVYFFSAEKTMSSLTRPNLAFVIGRQGQVVGRMQWNLAFVTSTLADFNLFYRGGGKVFPLYTFPAARGRQTDALGERPTLNFNPKHYAAICAAAGLTPSADADEGDAFRAATGDARPTEVKVFDYIYGVLHAPAYRERYAAFLRIDFPRVPYPRDPATFAALSGAGEALRRLHLMEPAAIGDAPYPFTGEGDDAVAPGYPRFEDGRVLINAAQGFDAVPAAAWDHPVGGYLPARKWLKDRRGRVLSWADVTHYQQVVKVLAETDRLMRAIDLPLD